MGDIIQNKLTKQGSAADVAQNFNINDYIHRQYKPSELRAIVASEMMPRKVVGYLPKIMADVNFNIEIQGMASHENNADLIWINDQIKYLIPWLTEAQTIANIVGKAYVVLDRNQVYYAAPGDGDEVDSAAPAIEQEPYNPKTAIGSEDDTTTAIETGIGAANVDLSPLNMLLAQPLLIDEVDKSYKPTPDEQLQDAFPLAFPIDWQQENIENLRGVQVLPGDFYGFTTDGEYLYQQADPDTASTRGVEFINQEITDRKIYLHSSQVVKWLEDSKAKISDGRYVQRHQYQAIHRSHVIEITAFDYQDDSIYNIRHKQQTLRVDTKKKRGPLVSYRLTRFIPAFLRFASFVNASLNRMHRSEFIAYGKNDLGSIAMDIAQAFAKKTASSSTAIPGLDETQENVNAVIVQELERILNSAMNQGIVMYDKKHSIDFKSRTFTGIKEFNEIFRDGLIGSSGLTEFVLFGINSAGTGLASLDIRDRKYISDEVDSLWGDHWVPPLLHLANLLAIGRDTIDLSEDQLKLKLEKSFKLTDLEISEWLERTINAHSKLLEQRVLTPAMVLKMLASDDQLGQYFNLVQDDVLAHLEKLTGLRLDQMGSANRAGGLYPLESQRIRAAGAQNVAEIQSQDTEAPSNETKIIEPLAPEGVEPTSQGDSAIVGMPQRQGDAYEPGKKEKDAYELWQGYLNMTEQQMRGWLDQCRAAYGYGGGGKAASVLHSKRTLALMGKSPDELTESDYRAIQAEIRVIERNVLRHKLNRGYQPVRRGKKLLTWPQVTLRSHGVSV